MSWPDRFDPIDFRPAAAQPNDQLSMVVSIVAGKSCRPSCAKSNYHQARRLVKLMLILMLMLILILIVMVMLMMMLMLMLTLTLMLMLMPILTLILMLILMVMVMIDTSETAAGSCMMRSCSCKQR